MQKKISLVFAFAVTVSWIAAAYAAPIMQEGKWEITTKMEMKGMPMEMPAMKHTMCLTSKDMVPQKAEKNQDCKMISNKVEGNTVTWVMQCKDKNGTIDSTGKITYKGDGFDGTLNVDLTNKEGRQHMFQKMSGRRIGDCTK
jgi:hypothetical protein